MQIVVNKGGSLGALGMNEYEEIEVNDDYTPEPTNSIISEWYNMYRRKTEDSDVRYKGTNNA